MSMTYLERLTKIVRRYRLSRVVHMIEPITIICDFSDALLPLNNPDSRTLMSYLDQLATKVQKQKSKSLILTTVKELLEKELEEISQWAFVKTLMLTSTGDTLTLLDFAEEDNHYKVNLVNDSFLIFLNGNLVEQTDHRDFCGDLGNSLIEKINFISELVDALVKRHDMNECFDIDIGRLSIKTLYEDCTSHVICIDSTRPCDEPGADIVRTILSEEKWWISQY